MEEKQRKGEYGWKVVQEWMEGEKRIRLVWETEGQAWRRRYWKEAKYRRKAEAMGFLGGADSEESACMWQTQVRSLGQEDPLEKEMATHSSMLAWRISWTVRHSPWGRKESDMTKWLTHTHGGKCWKFKKFTPSFPSCFLSFLLCFWQTLIRNPQPDTQYSTSIV